MKKLKLWYWKRIARIRYTELFEKLDNYSCGARLSYFMNQQVRDGYAAFNSAVERVNTLDPEAKWPKLQSPVDA